MLRNLWETVLSGTILAGFFATVIPLYIDYLLKRRQAEQQELLKGRLAEQQELLKGYLAADLERAKHSLVLEQSRLTFVYEKQRDSFTNVIRAMHAAITAFKFDYSDEEWLPIDEDTLADFRSVRVSESLYTGSDGDRAITVFEDRLAGCTLNRMDGGPIEGDLIRDNRSELAFISLRLQEFFRVRLGIAIGNPLLDVFRLQAFSMINGIHLREGQFPTKGLFERRDRMTPEEIVDICRQNDRALVAELSRLEARLKESQGASFFYRYQDQARTYRELLSANIDK